MGATVDRATLTAASSGSALASIRTSAGREVAAGGIMQQDPPPGATPGGSASIRVWVSSGPRATTVPGLVGQNERTARMRVGRGRPRGGHGLGVPLTRLPRRRRRRAGPGAEFSRATRVDAAQPRRTGHDVRDARSRSAPTASAPPKRCAPAASASPSSARSRTRACPPAPSCGSSRPADSASALATDLARGEPVTRSDCRSRRRSCRPISRSSAGHRRGRARRRRSDPRRRHGRAFRPEHHDRSAGGPRDQEGGDTAARRAPDDRGAGPVHRRLHRRRRQTCCRCTRRCCRICTGRLRYIKSRGAKAGAVLNPSTPVSALEEIASDVDFVLVMSVNPGFGGQAFIRTAWTRCAACARSSTATGSPAPIEIDGGIDTAPTPPTSSPRAHRSSSPATPSSARPTPKRRRARCGAAASVTPA